MFDSGSFATTLSDSHLHLGSFGEWSHTMYCPSGYLTSFQIRVEPHQGLFGDDTAVNNIKFRCSSNPMLEGPGMSWGEYGQWSQECQDGGICGIESKMETYQYGLDDSTLNDVRFHCCSVSQKVGRTADSEDGNRSIPVGTVPEPLASVLEVCLNG